MKRFPIQLALALAAGALSLSAAPVTLPVVSTLTMTLPEFTGGYHTSGFPLPAYTIGTFSYTIPNGDHIVAATFSSTFGNAAFVDTAAVNVFVGGIAVGTCAAGAYCNINEEEITSFTYTFKSGDLAILNSGSLNVTDVQMGGNKVQLGRETLNIALAANTPEPSSIVLLGMGLAGLATARLRKRQA